VSSALDCLDVSLNYVYIFIILCKLNNFHAFEFQNAA